MKKISILLFIIWFENGLLSQTISVETKIGKSKTNYTFIKKIIVKFHLKLNDQIIQIKTF